MLEGLLARLAVSDLRDRFVLKGGVLLAAFGARRPTKDVDLAGLDIANETEAVLDHVCRVLTVASPSEDGLEFIVESATADVIREEDDYSGVRVHVQAHLASAKLPFHVDVNVGDPIWPSPTTVSVPRLRGGEPIELRGYPMHMVHAEKIVTAIQRGTANTRWRDFGDIWTLLRQHAVTADDLARALNEVASHRNATIRPLAEVLDGYAELGQTRWLHWRRRSDSDHLPEQFASVLAIVSAFADPVVTGRVAGAAWSNERGTWE